MFEEFHFFIVMYSIQNGLNHLEHMVGFEEPPTIQNIKHVLDEVLEENLVPADKAIYMTQMPAEQAQAIFLKG